MLIVLHRRWIGCAGLMGCGILAMAWILWAGLGPAAETFAPGEMDAPVTVVVDPGHGGVDGGASTAEGVLERDLNLEIGLRTADALRFAGVPVVLTRATEEAIHTEGNTIRERKVSDTRNRAALVNDTENAVLLSIHQNSLPTSPSTHGAMVFWNGVEGAEPLGKAVQLALNDTVNAGGEKEARQVAGSIYLMNHIAAPGVLVECGFLSNPEEAGRLQTPDYQKRLAAALAAGILAGTAADT